MALALHAYDAEAEAYRCSQCGGDRRECQDPANQHAYGIEYARCYRTNTVSRSSKQTERDQDPRSLVAFTRHHPERVKPHN